MDRSVTGVVAALLAGALVGYVFSAGGRRRMRENIKHSSNAYLEAAEEDLEAAELLAERGNRLSSYHVQQASEKILKSILKQYGMEPRKAHEAVHSFARIPKGDPIRGVIPDFSEFDRFATSYKYPNELGITNKGLTRSEVRHHVGEMRALVDIIRDHYGRRVDPD